MASLVGYGHRLNSAIDGTSAWVARHIRTCAKPHRGLAGCICGTRDPSLPNGASRPTANTGQFNAASNDCDVLSKYPRCEHSCPRWATGKGAG